MSGRLMPSRERSTTQVRILANIIIITICAVICGAEGWVDVEEFGKNKRAWLATFLDLPAGIRSHDTFGRVFARIAPRRPHRLLP